MWLAEGWKDYELLDCGSGEKLERWGKYILVRPDPQAIWQTPRTEPAMPVPPPEEASGPKRTCRNGGLPGTKSLPLILSP